MLHCDFHFQRADFVQHVTLDTHCSVTGILGASGCGKTTFLHIVAGLLHPHQGYIRLGTQTFFDQQQGICLAPYQRRIGLVFQDRQLFPHLNVRQNLLYGYQHIPASERLFNLSQISELLDLNFLIDRPVRQLSGGEAQRVALGRALLYSPHLLLLDEPLSALDTAMKNQVLPFLTNIRDELRIPIIYVTHQKEELTYLQADIVHW